MLGSLSKIFQFEEEINEQPLALFRGLLTLKTFYLMFENIAAEIPNSYFFTKDLKTISIT